MTANERSVQAHYRTAALLDRILAGLREAGKDPGAPTVDDLAPADEFHSLGRVATKDLAELAALKSGTRVLDVGSGLGGPARFLAVTYGCDVTGVDLMPEFCAVASELSRRTGLACQPAASRCAAAARHAPRARRATCDYCLNDGSRTGGHAAFRT
jgi:SAM-dependent methyltransferase